MLQTNSEDNSCFFLKHFFMGEILLKMTILWTHLIGVSQNNFDLIAEQMRRYSCITQPKHKKANLTKQEISVVNCSNGALNKMVI